MSDFSKIVERFSAAPWRAMLVVLGIAFLSATIISTVMARFFLPEAKPVVRSSGIAFNPPNPVASLNQSQVDGILKRNIFNSEGAAVEVKPEEKDDGKAKEIVKSDLPVKLLGTIYSGDPFSGIAMVENSQKRTVNSFMVGDALMQGAVVKEIHKEKIIVDRSGRFEYIQIDRMELVQNRRSRKKTSAPAAAANASPGIAALATEPPPEKFREEGFERDKAEIVMTEMYRQKLLTADFTKVLQDAKASPNMVDGELKGFCLSRIRKDSIYEKAGLQNDDCISEINGVPLTDTAQAIRLLQSLRNEKEIEVRLQRAGSPMRFNLNIR